MRILVVDDDQKLCDVIQRGLEEEAYAVDCVYDGKDGQYYAENTPYDLIILDYMMPHKDGIEVCRNLRAGKINTPILMLTAKDEIEDRVKGLDSGADDYVVKPFAFSELLARVRAILRREGESRTSKLKVGDLVLDPSTREVWWKKKNLDLTTKEYSILEFLMRNPNAVVTRKMIEEHAWNYDFDSISNLVDVYIRRIRQKIDPELGKSIISTIRGAGYRIKAI
ncbi:MAG: response regulator transcription factor [Desulfobacteraceae bacterium]|nr:response regulator transcription factor [Desulfobacteraceae bacterium]